MQPEFQQIRQLIAEQHYDEAWQRYRSLLPHFPEDVELLRLGAHAGARSGRLEDAYADILVVTTLVDDPADAELLRHFECEMFGVQAQALAEQQRYVEADANFAKAQAIAPELPELYSAMGHVEFSRGRLDRATELFKKAAYGGKPNRIAHSNLLLSMTHSDRIDAETLFTEHVAWAQRNVTARASDLAIPPPTIVDRAPDRILRIGLLSADFRAHPVGHFVLPFLKHYDRSRLHVICYDDRPAPPGDPMAPLLRAAADEWTVASRFADRDLVQRVRDDRIDMLFDLAVHSDRNRLPFFALRAAPIQLSWLGYVGTTGMTQMDYRITDAEVDPPGESERYSTEKLLRLPETFWCYAPMPDFPAVREPNPDPNAPVRFGTATRLAKVSPFTLDLWCRLLAAVPDSSILLSDTPLRDAVTRGEWLEKFTSRGIDAARVRLEPGRHLNPYVELLGSNDIGLDTFPFNGGTTICHTLYMGTPVVALRGRAGVGRVTSSIVKAVGLPDLIANDPDEWIEINVSLARNPELRATLRRTLRTQMMASPLGDGPRFCSNFERALRDVWRGKLKETQAV